MGPEVPKFDFFSLMGRSLTNATLGIIGMGKIGLKAAERARAFGMNINYHNRTKRDPEDEKRVGATFYTNLHEMLPLCDFIMITCPLSTETVGLISYPEFNCMKENATLINVTRVDRAYQAKIFERVSLNLTLVFPDDLIERPELKDEILGALVSSQQYEKVQKTIASLPNLKVVSNVGAGTDHLDFQWLRERGIRLGNTPDVVSDDTADIGLGLLLMSACRMLPGAQLAMGPEVPKFDFFSLMGRSLTNATLGIIGMGKIGLKAAERARAFGMNINYHNRTKRDPEDEKRVGATFYTNLHEMLPLCDFIMITCPLSTETVGLISYPEFNCMKENATLINIARGKIVNHDALVQALSTKNGFAAALDVTEPEPLPRDHPLLQLPNVVITPHSGTDTFETTNTMLDMAIRNIECCLQGRPLPAEVHLA